MHVSGTIRRFWNVFAVSMLLSCCACYNGCTTTTPIALPFAQMPALESILVVDRNTVVAQNTDSAYSVFPTSFLQLRVRATWPTDFTIFMHHATLGHFALQKVDSNSQANNHPEFDQQGYFSYTVEGIGGGEGFYKISVHPPQSLRVGDTSRQVGLQIRNLSLDKSLTFPQNQQDLLVLLDTFPIVFKKEPNTIFDHGENSRDFQNPWPGPLEKHALWCIVA